MGVAGLVYSAHSIDMTAEMKKQADVMVTALTPAQRIELADALYASVPQEYQATVEKTWEREIDRRLDQYEAGRAAVLTSDESFARARKTLDEARRASLRSPS